MNDVREGSIVIIVDEPLKGIARVESIKDDVTNLKDFILYFEDVRFTEDFEMITTPKWLRKYGVKTTARVNVKRPVNPREFEIFMSTTT